MEGCWTRYDPRITYEGILPMVEGCGSFLTMPSITRCMCIYSLALLMRTSFIMRKENQDECGCWKSFDNDLSRALAPLDNQHPFLPYDTKKGWWLFCEESIIDGCVRFVSTITVQSILPYVVSINLRTHLQRYKESTKKMMKKCLFFSIYTVSV